MKVKITCNPITPYGSFSTGQIIDDKQYPESFLKHLVDEAGAGVYVEEYETKVEAPVETKKPVKKKTAKKKAKKRRSS